jgi:hypothetical protein
MSITAAIASSGGSDRFSASIAIRWIGYWLTAARRSSNARRACSISLR